MGWRLENDTIKGQFVGEVAGRLQAFNFSIGNEGLKYGIANNQKSDSYLEGLFLDSTKVQIKANSAYNQGKLAVLTRLDKKPDCQVGFSCGDSCINKHKECEIRHPQAKQASQWMLQRATQNSSNKFSQKEIEETENRFRQNAFESAAVFDAKTGQKIFEKKGFKTFVVLTDEETKKAKGAIFTHNHPWVSDVSASFYSKGISFSPPDVASACINEMAEIRACTSHYNHSMKPPKEGWNKDFYYNKVQPSFARHQEKVGNELIAKVRQSSDPMGTAQEVGDEVQHLIWERVAKETGMTYQRTAIPISKEKESQIFNERIKTQITEEQNRERFKGLMRLAVLGIAGAFLLKKYYKDEEQQEALKKGKKQQKRRDATREKPQCKTGIPCGNSCVSSEKECENISQYSAQISQQMIRLARSSNENTFSVHPDTYKEVKKVEERIRYSHIENGVIIDTKTGKKVLEKKGTTVNIPFTLADTRLMKGNILTHNHPWDPLQYTNPRIKGQSFSEPDIFVACTYQMAEVRACTSHYAHSMRPPKGGWSKEFYTQKIRPSVEKHRADVVNEFNFKIRTSFNPQKALEFAEAEMDHEIWKRVSKDTGMYYERSKLPLSREKEKEIIRERQQMLGIEDDGNGRKIALALAVAGLASAFLVKKYYRDKRKKQSPKIKRDAVSKKPKCETGIACGNSCVSSKKECESSSSEVKGFSRGMVQLARSTTSGVSAIASAEIQKAENRIRNNPSESAVVVDARTGKTLVDRQGYKTGVFFTRDDISHFKGNVMTHNHPWLPNDGVTNKGISFSQEDIFAACGTQMAEMRACTSFYNHSMKPPKEGWDENFFNTKVKPSFEKHEKEVIKEFVAKIRNVSNPMEIQKAAQLAETERFHLTWERVAKETGMIYSRTKIPNVNEDQIIRERQNEINQEQQSAQRRKKLLQLAILGIASAFLLKNHYKQKGVQQ